MPKRRRLPADARKSARAYRKTIEEKKVLSETREQKQEEEDNLRLARKKARKTRRERPLKTITYSWDVGELITFRNTTHKDGQVGVIVSVDENPYRDWHGNLHEGRGVTIFSMGRVERVDARFIKKIERI